MRKNNETGTIPVKTSILNSMKAAIVEIYMNLSEEEMKSLQMEIRSVTETNCDCKIYDIAQMMQDSVAIAINGI